MLRRGGASEIAPARTYRLHRDIRGPEQGNRPVRKLQPGRLVIASHNEGKVREIAELLGPYGIEPVSAAELDLPEPDEIGATFVDNADLKARQASDLSGLPALADDSGLCVDALDRKSVV